MSTNMTRVSELSDPGQGEFSFEFDETITGGAADGAWVRIPSGINNISVTLKVTTGSGKIQITNDTNDTILTGTPTAVDWPLGVVTETTEDACKPVSAIRQVNVSGTTQLLVRVQ